MEPPIRPRPIIATQGWGSRGVLIIFPPDKSGLWDGRWDAVERMACGMLNHPPGPRLNYTQIYKKTTGDFLFRKAGGQVGTEAGRFAVKGSSVYGGHKPLPFRLYPAVFLQDRLISNEQPGLLCPRHGARGPASPKESGLWSTNSRGFARIYSTHRSSGRSSSAASQKIGVQLGQFFGVALHGR